MRTKTLIALTEQTLANARTLTPANAAMVDALIDNAEERGWTLALIERNATHPLVLKRVAQLARKRA